MRLENIAELTGVRKVYRMGEERIVALAGIDLTIQKGEVCCLLGASGSGKSTLLNMMAGLEKPTKGDIRLRRHRIEKMNENELALFRQQYVGFVFQSYNLLPSLTALENVCLPMVFMGMSAKKRVAKATQMLKDVGLGDRLRHRPNQMSGGQQQRVSIARAFVNDPEIIFADEPTGNLDSRTARDVLETMLRLVRQHNQTLIMVTHNAELAEVADKVVYIRDGHIEKIVQQHPMDAMQEGSVG